MKKNGFFIAAGILSLIEAVAIFVCELVWIISLIVSYFSSQNSNGAQAAIAFVSVIVGVFLVFLLVVFVFALCNAITYLKNASKTYEQLHKNGWIIAVIVFSFLFGAIIVGILGLLGYLTKQE